ncbi:MAG: hypothetical protein WC197_06180 [Candidatus Gastranaerophilaceae bacterium]|jgi:hypothetical protein
MAIGANDYIDRLLVKKYANEQVDNHDMAASAVPPEKMYEIMNDYAASHRMMLGLQAKLKQVGAKLQSHSASRNYARQTVY